MKNLVLPILLILSAGAVLALTGCCAEEEPTMTAAPPRPAPKPAPKPVPKPVPKPAPHPPAGQAVVTKILPPGTPDCGAVKVEMSSPRTVRVGQDFDFTARVTNISKAALDGVAVSAKPDKNFKLTGTSPKATLDGQTLKWAIGKMKPGETRTLTIRGSAKDSGAVIQCVDVTWENPEVCVATRAVLPQLRIAKTGPSTVIQCDTITYKIVVSNTGTGPAHNVQVKDALPQGIATLAGKQAVAFQLPIIQPGESREFTFQAKPSKTGTFTNSATATADGGLSATSGPVTTKVTIPKLAVTKTGPKLRYVGRTAVYTITVANNGDAPAKDTVLVDTIPVGASLVSASNSGVAGAGKVTWRLGTIKAGDSAKVTVTVKLTRQGVLRNTAAATAYCAKGATEAVTTVKGIPAILLECIDIEDPIEVGSNETYVITVTNQGSAVGTNIVITCTLPAEQTFVSATGPTKHTAEGQTVTFAPLASLAAKAEVAYRVVVKGTKAGDVRFRVSLKSDQMETPAGETESTHIYSDE